MNSPTSEYDVDMTGYTSC